MTKGSKNKKQIDEAVAPAATPTKATSKAAMMANIVNGMAAMPPAELLPYFEQMQAMIGKEAASIPDGTAQKNLASINSTGAVVSEELKEILANESLSEDTMERATVLFESAVGLRVASIKAELEESFEQRLDEEIDKTTEALLEQVDKYLTYVAEQWIKENKAAVKTSVKTELAESFISGLYTLFKEHHFVIPEEQVDAVEALSEEVKTLREKLNQKINENVEARKELEKFQKEDVITQETDGLALTQREKIKKLAEGVDFGNDVDTFRKKVKLLKESHFPTKKKEKTDEVITETVEGETAEKTEEVIDVAKVRSISALAKYMSQSVNK